MEIPSTLCSNVYDFAFCPEPCYDRLVDLADPEDWGPSNRILKNYLSFSFSRAVFLTERDVDQTAPSNLPLVFDDDRCLFNTGLYTRRYDVPLFALIVCFVIAVLVHGVLDHTLNWIQTGMLFLMVFSASAIYVNNGGQRETNGNID